MRSKIFAGLATLVAVGGFAVVSTAPAEAAKTIHIVNHTDGNVYVTKTVGGTRYKVAPGHTSPALTRTKYRLLVYSTNIYGLRTFGDAGTQKAVCLNPGTYADNPDISDGASNQLLADDNCKKP